MTEEQEVTVCIAVYEHKHGDDMSVHRTIEGAEAHLREIAKENLEEWGEDTAQHGDDVEAWNEVWRNWHDMTGMTEFMRIEALTLND
jgi:hypothetical protein|tara:strand:- start:414 stop:674 length:261 start_codon:yes stop_codon:yes gene_type:complete